MKKANYLLVLLPALLLGFTSCKKCADCTCANTYEFGPAVDEDSQESLKSAWEVNHPEKSEEICGKKKDFEADTEEFEEQDDIDNANSIDLSNGFSVETKYTCNCIEQD